MRALNVLLALLVSLALLLAIPELGLRLLGRGPSPSLHRFDPDLGWVKEPGRSMQRSTAEFQAHFQINEQGLRDDPMPSPAKSEGTLRVLMLGDSFVLGYTVERQDLFVDQLERWWQAEGRQVDVINAGTEGYSTDQEALWLERHGAAFQPDVVLLFPYENDLYWCAERSYGRYPKPQVSPQGKPVRLSLVDPGPKAWWENTALGNLFSSSRAVRKSWSADGERELPMEYGAYFREPPEFMRIAREHTRGSLLLVRETCRRLGARLLAVPIPGKAAIEPSAQSALERSIGIDPQQWSADQPVDTFVELCRDLEIECLDPRTSLRSTHQSDAQPLYYSTDWHFNPHGNASFARYLHGELDKKGVFPAQYRAQKALELPEPQLPTHWPRWPWVYAGLVLLVGTLYSRQYRDEPTWRAYLSVALMLGLVFALFFAAQTLLGLVPPRWAAPVMVLLIGSVLGFVLYKLGRRLETTLELLLAFTWRGHWYLLPLVVILLSIGSLLVVAASSPLVAPFIYTLF